MKNKKNYQLVSVSGCYWTGSSAVLDILREHACCAVVDDEFCGFSYGEMFELFERASNANHGFKELGRAVERLRKFGDSEPPILFSALRFMLSNLKIYPPFLFYFRMGMERKVGSIYREITQDIFQGMTSGKFFVDDEGREEFSCLIHKLLWTVAEHSQSKQTPQLVTAPRLAVFDQLIAAPYVSSTLKIIPSLKCVNVDRDWRDQYVEMRPLISRLTSVNRSVGSKPWGENWEALDSSIDFFVDLRRRINEQRQSISSQTSIYWMQFEDLVYEPEAECQKLFRFLDIEKDQWNVGRFFNAEESKKNIGKWRHAGIDGEIAEIEQRLGQ